MRIRETLKDKRLELGLSQRVLAQKLSVTHSLISKVESGDRRLDVVELKRYTAALGLDFGVIVELLV
ncbi:MAG: helix-turn-helix domain-containing protein [Gammaproteobacteria bacterium]|nr:helix-turn-helix domain-containing protein [Gammaproteobacteria bacterium]